MTTMEIPEFLRRTNQTQGQAMPEQTPAATPPAKAPKKRRQDCYVANVRVSIPLDMSDADSLAKAIKAVQGIKDAMPAGTVIDIRGALGKI